MRERRWLSLMILLAVNCAVYWGAMALTAGRSAVDMSTALDKAVPVVPAMSAAYVGAYGFWAACYLRLSREGDWPVIFRAELGAKLLCFVCFLCLPTAIARPEPGGGLWSGLVGLIYALDEPRNLFPSIHCLESWLCWVSVRGRESVSPWARRGMFLASALICLSTVTIRQHVLADGAAGILLAEGCLFLSRRFAGKIP